MYLINTTVPVTGMSHWPVLCSQVLDLICVLQQWFLIIRNGVIQKEKPPTVQLDWTFVDQAQNILILSYKCVSAFPPSHLAGIWESLLTEAVWCPAGFDPSKTWLLCLSWGHRLPCTWYQGLVHGTCGSLANLGVVSKNRGGWKTPKSSIKK